MLVVPQQNTIPSMMIRTVYCDMCGEKLTGVVFRDFGHRSFLVSHFERIDYSSLKSSVVAAKRGLHKHKRGHIKWYCCECVPF